VHNGESSALADMCQRLQEQVAQLQSTVASLAMTRVPERTPVAAPSLDGRTDVQAMFASLYAKASQAEPPGVAAFRPTVFPDPLPQTHAAVDVRTLPATGPVMPQPLAVREKPVSPASPTFTLKVATFPDNTPAVPGRIIAPAPITAVKLPVFSAKDVTPAARANAGAVSPTFDAPPMASSSWDTAESSSIPIIALAPGMGPPVVVAGSRDL
jgi:hypothetical protein